jgi:hypothetical protein
MEDCPHTVPAGEPSGEQAQYIFNRAVHEARHLGEAVHDGTPLERSASGGEYLIAAAEVQPETAIACISVIFRCWSGQHGSFGPAALDGSAWVLVDGEHLEVVGLLGLAEGGAFVGAPAAIATIVIDGDAELGSIGGHSFP